MQGCKLILLLLYLLYVRAVTNTLVCYGLKFCYVISPLNHMMNIILGVILWSLKKFSRNDRGKMFTARPRRTRTCKENNYLQTDSLWGNQRNQNLTSPLKKSILINNYYIKNNSTYYAPDDKGYFKFVREAEDGETKEGKHTCLWTGKVKLVLKSCYKIKTKRKVGKQKREITDHTWRPLCAMSAAWGSEWRETSCDGCSETSQFQQTG